MTPIKTSVEDVKLMTEFRNQLATLSTTFIKEDITSNVNPITPEQARAFLKTIDTTLETLKLDLGNTTWLLVAILADSITERYGLGYPKELLEMLEPDALEKEVFGTV